MRLIVEYEYRFRVEMVFDAWLDAGSATHWLFATPTGVMQRVEIDPRVGGTFLIVERRDNVDVAHYGKYSVIDRPRLIKFSFSVDKFEPDADPITLSFQSTDMGCAVKLTHEMNGKWAEYAERTRSGWFDILAGLDRTLSANR